MKTREDILRIGMTNPHVHTLLAMVERGDMTWEQALMWMVCALYEHNEVLMKALGNRPWWDSIRVEPQPRHPDCPPIPPHMG